MLNLKRQNQLEKIIHRSSVYIHKFIPLTRLQRRCHVGELALLELRVPEDRVHVIESVVHPSLFLDVVQVNETTGVGITVHGSQNGSAAEVQCLLLSQLVFVLGVQHTVSESLTRSDTEQVTGETGAVGVDVVQGGSFLGRHLELIVSF